MDSLNRSGGPWDELRVTLRALESAEQSGDVVEALRLKGHLVSHRLLQRLADQQPAADLDIHILDAIARDLRRLGIHEPAITVCHAAAALAESVDDSFGRRHFELAGASACISSLDFLSADELVRRALHPATEGELDWSEDLVRKVVEFNADGVTGGRRVELVVEGLVVLGQLWAARGSLTSAEVALSSALGLAEDRATSVVTLEEIAVRLAEVRLDCGDLAGFDELSAPHLSISPAPYWRLLFATAAQMRGYLSEAEHHFGILASLEGARYQEIVRNAAWKRFFALCFLNRFDDAEEALRWCEGRGGIGEADVLVARSLLNARRSGLVESDLLPPSPYELTFRSSVSRAEVASASVDVRTGRTHERVLGEWVARAHRVRLALEAGQLVTAAEELAILEEWVVECVDSTLIVARHLNLSALVHLTVGEASIASEQAQAAVQLFRQLELILDEWNACQILGRALALGGAGANRRDVEARARSLLATLGSRQRDLDARLMRLNKPSPLDEELSSVCQRLAIRLPGASERDRQRLSRAAVNEILGLRQGSAATRDSSAAWPVLSRPGQARVCDPEWHPDPSRMPSDLAVLVYVVLVDQVVLFVTTRSGTQRVDGLRPCTRAELWSTVRSVTRQLRHMPWNPAGRRLNDLAAVLGVEALVKTLPDEVKRLAILPDDILGHVPFAALPMGSDPLVARHSVFMVPSACWSQRRLSRCRSYRPVLGVAVSRSSRDAEELPLARHDLSMLETELGPIITLADEGAQRRAVSSALEMARVAHFACHGKFSPETPDRSGLLLYDEWLTVRDLDNLDLSRLELLCAGACWSGNAAAVPGSQPIGLPMVINGSGANVVVSSLWAVREAEPQQRVLQLFYESLATHGPVDGLARAQARAAVQGIQPAFWAGLVAHSRGVPTRLAWRLWFSLKTRVLRGLQRRVQPPLSFES